MKTIKEVAFVLGILTLIGEILGLGIRFNATSLSMWFVIYLIVGLTVVIGSAPSGKS